MDGGGLTLNRRSKLQHSHQAIPFSWLYPVLASGRKYLSSTVLGAFIILLLTLLGPSVGSSCQHIFRASSRLQSALIGGGISVLIMKPPTYMGMRLRGWKHGNETKGM